MWILGPKGLTVISRTSVHEAAWTHKVKYTLSTGKK